MALPALPRMVLMVAFSGSLLGCPTPPAPQGAQPLGVGVEAPPSDAAAPAAADVESNQPGFVPQGSGTPTVAFGRYLQPDTPTVKIHGVVKGIEEGQVDFTTYEDDVRGGGQPEAVHVQMFEGGKFDVTAPANFERPVFVSAMTTSDGGPQGAGIGMSILKDALLIGDKNITITLELEPADGDPGKPLMPPEGGQLAPVVPAVEAPAEAPAEGPATPPPPSKPVEE